MPSFSHRVQTVKDYYPNAITEDPQLPLHVIESSDATVVFSQQGAQLLSFIPKEQDDWFWLSPNSRFIAGQAIRGGVPICLPWFGSHRSDVSKPSHGFARNVDWQLQGVEATTHERLGPCIRVAFGLDQYAQQAHPLFPFAFSAQLICYFNDCLQLEISVTNTDHQPLPLSWALHSYHPVDNLHQARVTGLDGCYYLDNAQQLQRQRQQGDVTFNSEVDRVFVNAPAEQRLVQRAATSTFPEAGLKVSATGSATAIVWNPGVKKAAAMNDLGAGHQVDFVCLERGDAFDNAVELAPQECHRATLNIELFS